MGDIKLNEPRLTISHGGHTYVDATPQFLRAAGVPQEVIDAELARQRAQAVKAECKRRIYAVMSAETQMNITAVSAAIAAKPASARSPEEKATLAAAGAALAWVDAMRARAAELAGTPDVDYRNDAAWPAVPDEVKQLVERY